MAEYEEKQSECQYEPCSDEPVGALKFFFGIRWYCLEHYTMMANNWEKDFDVYEKPEADTDEEFQ